VQVRRRRLVLRLLAARGTLAPRSRLSAMPAVRRAAAVVGVLAAAWSCGNSQASNRAPCAALVTDAEIRALGRSDVLTRSEDRSGASVCEWLASPPDTAKGFVVSRETDKAFARDEVSAAASFDMTRKAYDSVVGTDPIPDLALEARMSRQENGPVLFFRTTTDVVTVTRGGCSRDELIAIGRAAATP
jgi:hypothetical protein